MSHNKRERVSARAWAEKQGKHHKTPNNPIRRRRPRYAGRYKPAAFYVSDRFPSEQFPDLRRDYAHCILNLLHWQWINWQADDDGYVTLKYDLITRVVPDEEWPSLRRTLRRMEVIEHQPLYIAGKQSQGYRLTRRYRKTRCVVCEDDDLSCRIAWAYSTESGSRPVHKWLADHFDRLEFDEDRARSIIRGLSPDPGSPISPTDYRTILEGQVVRIVNKDFRCVCDNYGRFHTPITSLPKELRCCLMVDGEQLVNLDLANSQPLMAGFVAREFYRSRTARKRLLDRTFPDGADDPYRSRRSLADGAGGNDGVEEYIGLCERGLFYESLMESGEDRAAFKERFYAQVFFGKTTQRSALRRRFAKRFPEVATVIDALKRHDYRKSAWVMQNAEATIFIDGIAGRLMKLKPKMPVFTIHDSFLVRRSDSKFVASIVNKEFEKRDTVPTLKEESYGRS